MQLQGCSQKGWWKYICQWYYCGTIVVLLWYYCGTIFCYSSFQGLFSFLPFVVLYSISTPSTLVIGIKAFCTSNQRCLRAVPEIILRGEWPTFFFRPLHPQDTHGVRVPRPAGHVSALINLSHYGSNTPWAPGQVTSPPPTPRTHCQKNTLHPQDKKVFAAPPG